MVAYVVATSGNQWHLPNRDEAVQASQLEPSLVIFPTASWIFHHTLEASGQYLNIPTWKPPLTNLSPVSHSALETASGESCPSTLNLLSALIPRYDILPTSSLPHFSLPQIKAPHPPPPLFLCLHGRWHKWTNQKNAASVELALRWWRRLHGPGAVTTCKW